MSLPQLRHPGPVTGPRLEAVPCGAHPVTLRLRAGQTLAAAVAEALAAAGFGAGYLRLDGLHLAPLVWVIPAPAPGDGRVAWFSAPRRLAAARIEAGGVHLGQAGADPFCHCHGWWTGGDRQGIGHVLCEDSLLAADAEVSGWGIAGAAFRRTDDPETGFPLFAPAADAAGAGAGAGAWLCRIRPNEDPAIALAGLAPGRLRVEGLGSLVGANFLGAAGVSGVAAEFLIERGTASRAGAALHVAATGMSGEIHRGRLAPGRNAVCVTAELLVLPAP